MGKIINILVLKIGVIILSLKLCTCDNEGKIQKLVQSNPTQTTPTASSSNSTSDTSSDTSSDTIDYESCN